MRASIANASRSVLAASAIFFTCLQAFAGGPLDRVSASQSQDDDATDQIIIKMRDPSTSDIANRIRGVSVSSGVLLTHLREMSGNSQVVKLTQKLKRVDVDALVRILTEPKNALARQFQRFRHIAGDVERTDTQPSAPECTWPMPQSV